MNRQVSGGNNMEQYLTAKELGERIKMSPGTIRNLVWKKVFIEDIHFLKPTPRKLIFIWSAVEDWLHGGHAGRLAGGGSMPKCLINI